MDFLNFPNPIIDKIYSKCSINSRLNLIHSCKELYNYYDQDKLWQEFSL